MGNKKHKVVDNNLKVSALSKQMSESLWSRARIKLFVVTSTLKRFFREYRLPGLATIVFLSIALLFAGTRLLERTSLISLRNNTSTDGDYSILLSNDPADSFSRLGTDEPNSGQDANSADDLTNTTQSTSNSFQVPSISDPLDSGSGGSAGGSSGGSSGGSDGGSSGGGGTGGGENPPPDPDPQTVSIDYFTQGSVKLECANPSKPHKNNCSKTYTFNGGIKSINGPGIVAYTWQSSISAGDGVGSLNAGSGTTITAVSKTFTLSCRDKEEFTMQLILTSPNGDTSNLLLVDHNCDEL